jgi:beta-N-acetylhexosaminidase
VNHINLKKKSYVFLCVFILTLSPALFSLSFFDTEDDKSLARRIVDEMTDEQALAQCFMVGWVGAEPSPLVLNWIQERNIGGVKIFGWNTDDTRRLAQTVGALQTHALRTQFGIPLFVATDQEGGWVRHVKGATSETPGNMAIGASGIPMDAYRSGLYIGREMALLGINMNFAPTVDLFTSKDSYLIGPRSFGMDPVQAGMLGAAFAKGQEVSGVISTAKHYPGHGDTHLDSHGVLPRIELPFQTLWERELVPYRLLIREGLPAIMSGHLAFPNTPAGETPASLSPWFLTNILREQMGFQGLIITDDLMMNGATTYAGSLSRAAKQALQAGNDIIMLSRTPNMNDQIWTFLLLSMKEEREFHDRVRDAARRSLEVKLKYLKGEKRVPFVPDLKKVDEGLPYPEGADFFLNLAARSTTIVKNGGIQGKPIFPLTPEKAGQVLLAGRYTDFFSAGEKAFPNALVFRTSGRSGAELVRACQNVDTVIFCLSDAEELRLLQNLKDRGKQVVVFSILNPIHVEEALWADGILAVYSYAPYSFIAGFSAILGRFRAQGTFPFPLNVGR